MADRLLDVDAHVHYVASLEHRERDFEYWLTEHMLVRWGAARPRLSSLRSGYYWGLCASTLLGRPGLLDASTIVDTTQACFDAATGGYSGNIGHDAHILHTLSAVQIFTILGKPELIQKDSIIKFILGLQCSNGSFAGDQWKEVDTRYSFCALACLHLLGHLPAFDAARCASYLLSCQNADGGFGARPGGESHAGQTFCCLAALSLSGHLGAVRRDVVAWLAERQLAVGVNGRPDKPADACYAWWVCASLSILDRLDAIDASNITQFLLSLQLPTGGFSAHPNERADIFHTHFALAALAVLRCPQLPTAIEPRVCLPVSLLPQPT